MIRVKDFAYGTVVLGIVLVLTVVNCQEQAERVESQNKPSRKDNKMSTVVELEGMLAAGDRGAVDLARQLSEAAWPAISHAAKMPDYRSRRIAMICAGQIGGDKAGSVLSSGLLDTNVNVRIAAAKQLSVEPPATAQDAVLDALSRSSETRTSIREFLALAAGYLPGDRTIQVLRPLAKGTDPLALNARMALAKLGDPDARKSLINKLSAGVPYTRYEGLEQLQYVNDAGLALHAKRLLGDRAKAQLIGPERNRQYRRVCDQAVDTLVYLLKLTPPFETNIEKIYSDAELMEIGKLAQ